MDIYEACITSIDRYTEELNRYIDGKVNSENCEDEFLQTQTMIQAVMADQDKNLDRILDQQAYLKVLIEKDTRIRSLKKAIGENIRTIEILRKSCAKKGLDAIKNRQELVEAQAKELERFQMQQLRSIVGDHANHLSILDTRKKEIETLKKEYEDEIKGRSAYLADVEKNLEKRLQERQSLVSL